MRFNRIRSPSVWLFVPVHRDLLGVREEPFLVGAVVVVPVRREIDEDVLFGADGCEAVPAVTGDADGLLDVPADDERVDFASGGGVLSVVVGADVDATL